MPEGHTLHRLARLHQKRFVRAPVVVSSPQGRFTEGAAAVSGRQQLERLRARLEETVAAGEPWPFEAFPAFAADLIDSWSDAPVLAQAEASAFLQAAWEPSEAAAAWLRLFPSLSVPA